MKKTIQTAFFVAILVCGCSLLANAQSKSSSAAGTAAKVPVVVVGSAAKGAWVTTKFTTKYVVAPVAKEVFLEATPAIAKFAAKNVLKYGIPIAAKWAIL